MALQWIAPVLLALISPFSTYTTVVLDGEPYNVYVADNVVKWAVGYMNTTSYDPRGVGSIGMVFLFPRNGTYCFWMKNTAIPLHIVWVSGTLTTRWVAAAPFDLTAVCGYGDKVLELKPDVKTPTWVIIGEQRPRH